MAFNPKEHLTKLQGKDYLEVRWRLVWFREDHPTGAITTELLSTEPSMVVRATVSTETGILATGYGSAPAAGKGTWAGRALEKAETAAIGRALGHAGYGTQFEADDETDNLADSPVERRNAVNAPNSSANGAQVQSTTITSENAPAPASGGGKRNVAKTALAKDPDNRRLATEKPVPPTSTQPRLLQQDEALQLSAWATAHNGDICLTVDEVLKALKVPRLGLFHGDLEKAKSAVIAWKAANKAEAMPLEGGPF